MRRFKAKMAWAGAIPAFMVLAVYLGGAGSGEVRPKKESGTISPVMTEASISSWEGERRLYRLEIRQLTLIPKQWGPFVYEDCRDLAIQGCHLQVTSDALISSLKDIGEMLLVLGRQPQLAGLPAAGPTGPGPADPPSMTLIGLPPRIEARNFSCRVNYPGGQVLTISADLATLDPPNPCLDLEGNVQVEAGPAVLHAAAACWAPLEEELLVLTPYTLAAGNQPRRGCNDNFSLARGELKRLRLAKASVPMTRVRAAPLTPAQFMAHLWGKRRGKRGDPFMSGMLLTTLQAQAQKGVMPLPADGPKH
ncbi:MAG: hypothetical protein WCD80_03965 [Desulfobaccales bacterium]